MNNYIHAVDHTTHIDHTNNMSCYGDDYNENAGYEDLTVNQADIKLLQDLSEDYTNAYYPFRA
ncbi:hypothetical protein ACQ33O_13095 [Ferruginibacter sp. SUN002]|uniref:hypothetical protein n=1 Tax=Ferruginibacter sp. SUN002 TaxID=2937789 RepID=UPI003D36026D